MPNIFSSAGFGNSSLRAPAPGPYHHLALANEYRGNRGCGSGGCESEPDMGEVYIPRGARALFRVCTSRCSSPPLSLSPRSALFRSRAIAIQSHARSFSRSTLRLFFVLSSFCYLLSCVPCLLSFVFLVSVRFRSIHFFASVIIDTVYPFPAGRTDREGQDETIGKKRIENREQERRTRQAFYLYPSERS